MIKKQNFLPLLLLLCISCKQIQDSSNKSPSPSNSISSLTLQEINNYTMAEAINFSNGAVDGDKLVKLNSDGKIDHPF